MFVAESDGAIGGNSPYINSAASLVEKSDLKLDAAFERFGCKPINTTWVSVVVQPLFVLRYHRNSSTGER